MGKRFVAIIMTISLCVTTVVGALRLSLRFVNAATPSESGVLYLNDLYDEIWNTGKFTSTQLDNFWNYITPKINDSSWLIYVLHQLNTDFWDIQVFQLETNSVYSYSDGFGNGISLNSNGTGGYISCYARLYNGYYTSCTQNSFLYRDIALAIVLAKAISL